eukprot:803476-Amphidinium_carterae.1
MFIAVNANEPRCVFQSGSQRKCMVYKIIRLDALERQSFHNIVCSVWITFSCFACVSYFEVGIGGGFHAGGTRRTQSSVRLSSI